MDCRSKVEALGLQEQLQTLSYRQTCTIKAFQAEDLDMLQRKEGKRGTTFGPPKRRPLAIVSGCVGKSGTISAPIMTPT